MKLSKDANSYYTRKVIIKALKEMEKDLDVLEHVAVVVHERATRSVRTARLAVKNAKMELYT